MTDLLATLLHPVSCLGCGAPGQSWCAACAGITTDPRWVHVGVPVLTGVSFEGPVRRAILEWKEHGSRRAGREVAHWLESLLSPLLTALPDAPVVPIPSSPGARRHRGAAPLEALLRDIVPRERCAPALVSTRGRADQAALDRGARARNLAHSMRWTGAGLPTAIVVDDVLTTGATMREGARALRDAGVAQVIGCALAHREHVNPVAPREAGLGW